ncbi:MAG: hypothetical protein R3C60_01995 [Parvularculaceae bacterium]
MIETAAALMLIASTKGLPLPESWRCRNEVEVWCDEADCAAKAEGEVTPMDISASSDGDISVCAYTGCWEGKADYSEDAGRLLWRGDELPFVSAIEGAKGDVTLLIMRADGVGFVRAGGLASPLTCTLQEAGE